VDIDGQPNWEGVSHGAPQVATIGTIDFVGHGLGQYAGLQVKVHYQINNETGVETMTGEILDPH
jgi:hypothetical protein